MILIRFIFSLFTYIVFYFLIKIPFSAMGLFLVPLMALFWRYTTKTEISVINGREILNWKHKFMFIWGNNEDGIMGAEEFKNSSNFVRIVYWSAYRNPANNLRFLPYITCKINPSKVKFKLSKVRNLEGKVMKTPSYYDYDRDQYRFISFIWQGLYSNFRIQFKFYTPQLYYKKLVFLRAEKTVSLLPHYALVKFLKEIFNLYYLRIRFDSKIWRFWTGWKIYAHDSLGVDSRDYRTKGAGFASQLKRIYPRNK